MRYFIIICTAFLQISCGSSDSSDSRDIVGNNAFLYSELYEVNNSSFSTPELTYYVLDSNGIKITGSFEAISPSSDYYLFYTGTSTGVDIQVFLNGVPLDMTSTEVFTSLDAELDDGYSALNGLNNARNAWLTPGSFFIIYVYPFNAAGKSYTIQMRSAQ